MSAVLPGLGGDQEGGGVGSSSSSSRELADIRAVLETATGALEEIRKQVSTRSDCYLLCVFVEPDHVPSEQYV